VRVRFAHLVNFHFHLEGVQLFLNLLGQHRCQTIARCNVSAPIILLARPDIMELDARTERDGTGGSIRRAGNAASDHSLGEIIANFDGVVEGGAATLLHLLLLLMGRR